MAGPRSPRIGAVVLFVVLSGCLSAGGAPSTETTTTAHPKTATVTSTETTTGPPARKFPGPPDTLTNETGKNAALEYEEVYIYNKLRTQGYSEWGVGNWSDQSATILNKSDNGVYVRVRMPYSYQYSSGYVDTGTEAVYFVSTDTIRRVQGSEVSTL